MKQLAVLMAATVSWAGVRNSIWAPVLATFGAFIVHFARRVVQVALFLTVLRRARYFLFIERTDVCTVSCTHAMFGSPFHLPPVSCVHVDRYQPS